MDLAQKIKEDLKHALKQKDEIKVSTLRLLTSALSYTRLNNKKESLSEDDIITTIRKQAKQRQDAIESYRQAGREDLRQKEEDELHILESYLPQQLSDDELKVLIQEALTELGVTSKKEMGKVIKHVLEKAKGATDGKRVSTMVAALLPS